VTDQHLHSPLPYPEDRAAIVHAFQRPWGRVWLRVGARVMEWLSDLQRKALNYSDVTPQIAVGGSFRKRQIKHLRARGVTAVVDCRKEASDDPELLAKAGIEFLHVPAPDRYALTSDQLHQGVEWVLDHLERGSRVFLQCEHGVGRGPLMACAVLVGQGYSAPEALRIVRSGRWQAMPNDRQLGALLAFEREWRQKTGSEPENETTVASAK
jgi:hypothetical protein